MSRVVLKHQRLKPVSLDVFSGGCDDTLKAHSENRLMSMINPPTDKYDYDLIVIGGGSGGLAASKVGKGKSLIKNTKKNINLAGPTPLVF